ncbi:MAG: hypoxanthine phosphoribosyltransferase [Verrucomicrobiales bacterium]|nr:hypoxanthine phosphoribosyltransferase [Verrucomicrobiales bacterium]
MGNSSFQHHEDLERVLFDQQAIRERVAEMGEAITADFAGREVVIIAVLQGGVLFLADLIREIDLPMKIDSISVASYHGGTESSGTVTFHQNHLPDVEGKKVIVLDDILDTGRTLAAIVDRLNREGRPESIHTAVLLSKRIERAMPIEADYFGFEVGDEFVVGYGLDYAGRYRNLPVVGVLKPEKIGTLS